MTTTTSASSGTSSISGLASGIDWQSIVTQLKTVEHAPIDLIETKKSDYEKELSEWQSFNTKLLSLKTAAQTLSDPDNFNVYTSGMTSSSSSVDAEDLLSVSSSSTASPGSYSIKVNNLATAQKLSSSSFSSLSGALGSDYAGDIIINGRAITISETDGLDDIKNRINNANSGDNATGVTASIISYSSNDYRLILTSDDTGADGISLQNGSSGDLLELFGWKDGSSAIKNSITGGAQSDGFSSSTQDVKTLLGLSGTQSGTIQVNGQGVAIDLSTDSLEDIKTKINSVTGVSASIITKTKDGATTYTLQINGTQTFVDNQNILETLGILTNGVSDVQGTSSSNKMTSDGDIISSSTLLSDIDGYSSWTSGDSISISGTDHSGISISDSFSISSSSTVQNLLDAIKTAFVANGDNVTAHLTSDGTIEVEDLETGTSSLTVSLSSSIGDGDLDWGTFSALGSVRKREIIAGQDASLIVDGEEITSKDNSIDDILPGVTLNLKNADENTTVTLNVERDVSAIEDKIQSLVDTYNTVASYISKQQTYDSTNQTTGGVLFGDGTLSSIKSDLTSILVEQIWGVSSKFSIIAMAGITLDNEGQLSVDSSKLSGFLETNFSDIQQLFAANGTTDSGDIEYISSTNDTEAGEYVVNITQAATKNSSVSDTAVSGTLGSDETLTITNGDNTAVISLTGGMTISNIVNAVNIELDTVYTEKLVGETEVTADSDPVASTTAWDEIDGADLVNDDIIKFTGTTRNGVNVSGSYAVDDISTDTIQGLLSEIESAFGDEVSASIDSNGHLVLLDDYEGTSNLSLTFDYTETTNRTDIFGTVLTTNDGGHEGRYAMNITASNDGSNHLQLSNDDYGSEYSFTVDEDTNTGLWSNSMTTPITFNNGKDVAGTINGKAATGSGQTLKGDDGEANIDGLVIKYTGTATGDVGNIKFTLGAAELFDRALFNITDPYEGYAALKQNSLSDHIKDLGDNIDKMEDRLTKKMSSMTARFQAMELAIAKLQNISSWLTSQLEAASNGWQSL